MRLPAALALVVAASCLDAVHAQNYPERPVRFLVGLSPGGGVDFVARVLAQKLTEGWPRPVVVENRPGANQIIATEFAAKARPDGYTVLIVNPAYTINPTFYRKLPYDTLSDFDPVTLLAQYPFLVVAHPSVPARSVKELIAVARARPGDLSYASSGNGSTPHLGMELFNSMANVRMVHVPYKGAGPASADLVAGHVQVMLINLSPVRAIIKAGRLRALAVAGSARSRALPGVPTVSESGLPGFNLFGWYGMVLPAGTPRAVKGKLHADVIKALRTDEVRERLSVENTEPVGNTPEEFTDFLRKEIATFAAVIRRTGAKAD